ncbi:hypothetical protein [Halarcobacter sp.]|uniref:hypothetical protein n=1 Tax=Halarcobacter sp. TaxID=2321133 RepID=UPI0029F4ADAB|nr:hypothetical protein [Halarcobacter sp.]
MIIYIYGSDDFKKDIHELLEHSNIKFRLGDNGEVIDLDTLEDLKNAIQDNPNNIYLIDDSKIIKKNSLNNKIKLFKPKDGIEQEYLLDHGIGDMSVDSMEELSNHIKNKLDAAIDSNESERIQESIVEIVEDAYDNEDSNDYIQLDEELKELLSPSEDEPKIEQIVDISSMIEDDEDQSIIEDEKENPLLNDPLLNDPLLDELDNLVEEDDSLEDDEFALKDLSFEEDFGNIEVDKSEDINDNNFQEENRNQGVEMADEFSEFDSLNEADLLAALDGVGTESMPAKDISINTTNIDKKENNSQSLNLGSSSADDIAKLISQLLNNKTLEITIKVKD